MHLSRARDPTTLWGNTHEQEKLSLFWPAFLVLEAITTCAMDPVSSGVSFL